ncbi:MAG: LacI family transcriptional regulator [Hyphomicrobiales bacterium]|nr:MAG: LacI family transcriptional regulator [Hyphomicrobiales bacterium]
MKPTATQKDVARKAGVSQATVSLVLNGSGGGSIPESTVLKINQAMKELGYSPNYMARALRTNQTMTLVCVVPDITNPYYPLLVRGVQTVAEAAGYDVITVNTDGKKDRELHYINMARQGRVDGVVGVFFGLTIRDMLPFVEVGIPIVRLEASVKTGGSIAVDDVFVDNCQAAEDLTSFLMSKGHRSIAMIAGRDGPQSVRVDGYLKALQAKGFKARIQLDDAFTEEGGARAATVLLDEGERPTAIIAANDLMAIGAMHTLLDRNVSIPDEIAIAGFDDIPSSRLVSPALTTVTQFQHNLGAEAARTLIKRLNGLVTGGGRVTELPYKIIERSST